jgi:hypothetical protein
VSTDEAQQTPWHVTVPGPLLPVPRPERALRWPADGWDFALTALYVVLAGPLVGLIWSSVGPALPLGLVLNGKGSFGNQVGADFNFLVLGGVAGLLCAAVAVALRRDGPGALLGLVVGGLGASVVADRVAYLAERGQTLDTLRQVHVSLATLDRFGIDPFFKVRALGVLVAWPMAALVLFTIAVAIRGRPR